MDKKAVRELADELENWPSVRGYDVDESGKHVRFIVHAEQGTRFMMMSRSPSDKNASRQRIRELRRLLRSLGAEKE
jgi:hypothetical protein